MIPWKIVTNGNITVEDHSEHPIEAMRKILSHCLAGVDTDIPEFDTEEAIAALQKREWILSTAAGEMAFPHAGVSCLSTSGLVVLGRFSPPINWPFAQVGDRPIRLILVMLFPSWMNQGEYIPMQTRLTQVVRRVLLRLDAGEEFGAVVAAGLDSISRFD